MATTTISDWVTAITVTVMAGATPGWAADGARSSVPTPSSVPARAARRVVVSIPDRMLALVDGDQVIGVYPVAVGAPVSPSPVGTFTIITRVTNPTYYRPGKVIAGATNPIGTRWIGLNIKGFGIHGTDDPQSIGFAKSHGCIRLLNEDVEALFDQLRAGDVIELHAERTPEIQQLFVR